MFSTYIIIAAILVSIIVFLLFQTRRTTKAFAQFPTPPKYPIFGHALDLKSPTEALQVVHEYLRKYGETIHIQVGPVMHALITIDHKLIDVILTSGTLLKKSYNYSYLKSWLGTGLLIINDGMIWKIHRKIITPAFHFEILNQYLEVIDNAANILKDKLIQIGDTLSTDIVPFVSLCTLDIICESAMGTKINAQLNENNDYVKSVSRMTRLIVDRTISPMKIYPATYWLTSDYRTENKCLKILHDYCETVVEKKLKSFTSNKIDMVDNDIGLNKKKAFLDLLLSSSTTSDLMSLKEVRDETSTFMFAGHDTAATAISFCLFCLAMYQDVQDKVLEEQIDIFGNKKDKDITINYQNLQKMKYLEMVIKETLRLYPPVPIIGRHTDTELIFGNRTIPKDIDIAIFIYGLHHHPKYFPEPEKFKPERFSPDNSTVIQPFSFIPFSAGHRNCIGQKFAMLEIKTVISKMVRNFLLVPANPEHNLILSAETVLKSANGIKLGLKRRK